LTALSVSFGFPPVRGHLLNDGREISIHPGSSRQKENMWMSFTGRPVIARALAFCNKVS
jgi:hypothetical protein